MNCTARCVLIFSCLSGFLLSASAQPTGSADLNNDGSVGPHDQFLFQDQWYGPGMDSVALFPDEHLENLVRKLVNRPAGELRASHFDGIATLRVPTQLTVYDLGGIEHFRNLQNLSVQFVRESTPSVNISVLPQLTGLRTLALQRISGTQVLTVDVTPIQGLTQLTNLALTGDQFLNVNVIGGLANLVELDITAGAVTDIGFVANLTRLISLRLSGNEIADISSLSALTGLIQLDMSNNGIVDISALANLTNLDFLNLGCNGIVTIQPLVDNLGLGEGDIVILSANDLDPVTSPAQIQALVDRGVEVFSSRGVCLNIF